MGAGTIIATAIAFTYYWRLSFPGRTRDGYLALLLLLALAASALLSLSRFEETGGRGHLALAALQAAAAPFFKVFLGAHLVLGLGVARLGGRRRHAQGRLRARAQGLDRAGPQVRPGRAGGGVRRLQRP